VVVSNLVDSNVFLRAVILSLEFFSARRAELQVCVCVGVGEGVGVGVGVGI